MTAFWQAEDLGLVKGAVLNRARLDARLHSKDV